MNPSTIKPGDVLYLRQGPLHKAKQSRFTKHIDGENKARPHVCVDVCGPNSLWTSLTSQDNRPRLQIESHWRQGGFQRWKHDPELYLWDGAFLIYAPTLVVLRVAADVELLDDDDQARITGDGLHKIRREIMKQRIRRPAWFDNHCADNGLLLGWKQHPGG